MGGLNAGRSARVDIMQRKGGGMKPSLFGALVIGVISLALCMGVEARQVVIDLSEQRVFLLKGGRSCSARRLPPERKAGVLQLEGSGSEPRTSAIVPGASA